MPKSLRGGLRLLAVLVIVSLFVPVTSHLMAGKPAGDARDFVTCVQQCNSLRQSCTANCVDICQIMFPNDKKAEKECTATCNVACESQSDNCKLACQFEFKGETPEIP